MYPDFLLKVAIFGFEFCSPKVAKPDGQFVNLMVEFRLDDLLGVNKKLTDQIAKLTAQNGKLVDIAARKGGGTAAAGAAGGKGKDPWEDNDWDPKGYCWTHGHKVKKGHNSITCNSRSPGHQVSARKFGREQTKKGSSVNWKWEEDEK